MSDTQQSVELNFKPLKKHYSQFCARFGKYPPETITLSFSKGVGRFYGHTPGTSVLMDMDDVVVSTSSKHGSIFTFSKDTIASFVGCNVESGTVTVKSSSIEIKSGRMTLELPIEESKPLNDIPTIDSPLGAEFQDFLKYTLPILKKTSCTISRSEMFLECGTEEFQNYNIASVLGKRIHLIESLSDTSSPIYQKTDESLSIIAPFDLLENVVVSDSTHLHLSKNTLTVLDDNCIATTQTREHSLGVDFATVINKIKEVVPGAIQFQFKTARLEQMLTSIPKPSNNSEYQLIFTLENESLSVSYKGKGVGFADSFKIASKKPIEEKKEFAIEFADLLAAALVLSDVSENCLATLLDQRLILTAKSLLGYRHHIAFARIC